ncbi:MAG: response regulator [Acidobacteriota bacterium]|nr:response regulator [Acidobacteriota bacterium]
MEQASTAGTATTGLSIRTRVYLAFFCVLIPLLASGILVYRTTLASQASERWVIHSHEVLQAIEDAHARLSSAESAARGFVISGSEEYTGSMAKEAAEALQRVRRLRQLTVDNPQQQERIARLEPLIQARLDLLAEIVRLRREDSFEAAVALVRTDRGKVLMDQINTLLLALEQSELSLLATRHQLAEDQAQLTQRTIIGATAASLVLVVLLGYGLTRQITVPLATLLRGAQAVAGGATSHRVIIQRHDEIGTLATAFNAMAGEIERREAELSIANLELQQQNREVQRATTLKSQFLAGMSHELRTPLNAILGFSELLADETPGLLNVGQKRFINHVRTASKHLLQLINDILDLSKIEAGQVEFQVEPFTVSSALAEVLSITRPLTMMKNLLVVNQVDREHTINGDRIRVKQVLYNLLSNAIKFTAEGGEIRVRSERHGEVVQVSVSDTGIGIGPADTAVIFEEFKQLGDTTRGVKEGTGLGLAISRRLLEQQGGTIGVESTPGVGSTFTFSMPAAALLVTATAAQVAPALAIVTQAGVTQPGVKQPGVKQPGVTQPGVTQPGVTPPGGPPRPAALLPVAVPEQDWEDDEKRPPPLVLVVDDDPAVVELQTHYLSSSGFLVEPAQSGEEGLAKARELRPDVITLDIMMPSQSGWETLHAIKSDPATARIPVVIVSVVEQRQLAIKLGAADCLVKPVSRSDLLAVVRRLTPKSDGVVTVLVVDNDARSAELSSAVLQAIGARPIWMSSGTEALRMIRRSRPDAVLLDLMMPGMDGFEVLGAIRADPVLADLPVYVLTGKDLTEAELVFLSDRTQLILRKTGNWHDELQARASVIVRQNAAAAKKLA